MQDNNHTHRDRQTDKQTHRQTHRQTHTDTQTDTQTDRHRHTQTRTPQAAEAPRTQVGQTSTAMKITIGKKRTERRRKKETKRKIKEK